MALKIAGNDSFKVKNVADLQQLDTLPSSANVIVEHGGFAKRFDASKLEGKVRSVNGIEPDENGNIEVAGAGGTVSWNDLADKPFGEDGSDVVIFENINLTLNEASSPSGVTYVTQLDSSAFSLELGKKYKVISGGVEYICVPRIDTIEIEGGEVEVLSIGNMSVNGGTAYEDTGENFLINYIPSVNYATYGTPSAENTVLSIYECSSIKTLDEKFIPDTIARVSDIPEGSAQINPDWNQNDSTKPDYVKNRTHWVEGNQTVIEWDGSTEGKEVIETDFFSIVKISDLVPAFSEFTKGKAIANGVESDLADVTFIEADGYYGAEDLPLIVTTKPNVIEGDATLPTPGVYHLIVSGMPIITRITYGSTTIHTLDSIYLPDALQIGGEDTTTLIEWDGQVGDKDTFQHDWHMAKVSDLLPTKEDLIGGYYDNYGTQTTITEDSFSESTGCVGVSGRFAVVTELEGQLGNYSYTAPSTGIYFAYSSSSGSVKCGYLKYGEDNITRFDEKFIPLSIARKGEISWNDLLDKPFGTETVEAESFSMQDMEFVDQSSEGGPTFYMYQLTDPFMTLHPDAEYLVNWGGVESTTLCQKLEPYTVLGNVGILADTLDGQVPEGLIATNEDYVIMKMEMNGQYYGTIFITTNSEQYVDITIEGPDHVDHKIDPKYLPTSVGSGLPEVSEEDEGKILQVVGGRWQLVTLVNTEEVEY